MPLPKKSTSRFKRADRVKILSSPGLVGVVQRRIRPKGLASDGARFYKVKLLCPSPKLKYKTVREDHLEPDDTIAVERESQRKKQVHPRGLRNEELSQSEFERIAAPKGETGRGVLRRQTASVAPIVPKNG